MERHKKVIAYTDGGSRGNPGESAYGVAIYDEHHTPIKLFGERIGVKTNNEAEYAGVIAALEKIKVLYGTEHAHVMDVEVRMDSELVCRQLNGAYRVKKEHLKPLFFAIWNLKSAFANIRFVHVPREKNKEADRMVNAALDGKARTTDVV